MQKYRIFLKRVSDASCKAEQSGMAGQSSFVSGNHNGMVLNKLKQQELRSLSLRQRIGKYHENNSTPVYNSSSSLSGVLFPNQGEASRSKGPFQVLCNQGLVYFVKTNYHCSNLIPIMPQFSIELSYI